MDTPGAMRAMSPGSANARSAERLPRTRAAASTIAATSGSPTSHRMTTSIGTANRI